MSERKGEGQQLTSSVAGIGNKERCRVAVRCDVEAASQSISPMQGGAHSLSSCGDEGGLAGLKLMAIKTPLAPHPIHYEQHCRRRRSSLVLPVPAFLASLALALDRWGRCPGRHKVGSRGQDSQGTQAPRARLPLHTGPTVLHFVPQASRSCPPLTQARQAPRARGPQGWPSYRVGPARFT